MFMAHRAMQALKVSGRTRFWLADQCGIQRDSLNAILCGQRNPSMAVVKLMALGLNVPLSELWNVEAAEPPGARKATG